MVEPKLKRVTVTSDFWKRYQELVVSEVLPYQWAVMNDEADINMSKDPQKIEGADKNSHAVANLKIAAGQMEGHHYGFPFQDTDVYKWLEAAAYSFSYHPNPELKTITDNLIELIASAQDDDGYLSTYFQIDAPERKFKRLQQSHELYTMGHYIEAGVAYHDATGNEKALEIAKRMADCIVRSFGTDDGQIDGYDGHPEIELALARLYEATHDQKYLDEAHYFLQVRGTKPGFFDKQNEADGLERDIIPGMREAGERYYLDAQPIADQETADGHAVRVVYLCTGMAYVARLTGDKVLLEACHRFWKDIVKRRMYVTGNVGSTTTGEAFTYDYDLPNDTMYGETCASVGLTFFARQMSQLETNSEYADVIEKELFNGALSGMALDGKHFFYVNPLEADPKASTFNPGKSHVLTHRADWFGCACCPANLARLITSLDQYIYDVKPNEVLSNQFISNDAEFANGLSVKQTSNFPWEGNIHFDITNASGEAVQFGIRLPNWSTANYSVTVNGTATQVDAKNGYLYVSITQPETTIDLVLDMATKFMRASNRVSADFGKYAVQRGPIVFCAEETDNDAALWQYEVSPKSATHYNFQPDLLEGVGTITVDAKLPQEDEDGVGLYTEATTEQLHDAKLKLVPYYAWANREDGAMQVWLNKE